jgi:hypothetical protein
MARVSAYRAAEPEGECYSRPSESRSIGCRVVTPAGGSCATGTGLLPTGPFPPRPKRRITELDLPPSRRHSRALMTGSHGLRTNSSVSGEHQSAQQYDPYQYQQQGRPQAQIDDHGLLGAVTFDPGPGFDALEKETPPPARGKRTRPRPDCSLFFGSRLSASLLCTPPCAGAEAKPVDVLSVALAQQERDWLRAHPVIRLARRPLFSNRPSGRRTGFSDEKTEPLRLRIWSLQRFRHPRLLRLHCFWSRPC